LVFPLHCLVFSVFLIHQTLNLSGFKNLTDVKSGE